MSIYLSGTRFNKMRIYLLSMIFLSCATSLYLYYKITNIDKISLSELKKYKILSTRCLALAIALVFQSIFWTYNNCPLTPEFRLTYLTGQLSLLHNINYATAAYDVGTLAEAVFASVVRGLHGNDPADVWTSILSNAGPRRDLGTPYTTRTISNNNNNNHNNNINNFRNNRRRFRRNNYQPNFRNNRNYNSNNYNNNNNHQFGNNNNRHRACARLNDGYCITHRAVCAQRDNNNNNNPN